MNHAQKRQVFLRGYASALAAVARGWNERGLVVMVMKGDGITLADLETAKVEEYDLVAIRLCWARENAT